MKIKMNGGEWVGEWNDFLAANDDLDKKDVAVALAGLLAHGRAEMNFGAAGTITLETI